MTRIRHSFLLPAFALLLPLTACPANDGSTDTAETAAATDTTGNSTAPTGDTTDPTEASTGSTGDTTGAVGPDCSSDKAVCMSVSVPADFTGNTVRLVAALYPSLPPLGPPAAILAQVDAPVIGAGMPVDVQVFDVPDKGDYFVFVILLMEGGGTLQPVAGVDYTGQTAAAVAIGGAGVDLGEVALQLYMMP